ncbi:endonuclease domain-containing protein [Corynebacterium sp. LK2510]|uniref:endonuclease domain-containing protein n=1 Tax=Corynebacterium sp. LK2510 TaxID=3110472 RepID=UPI0034CF223C
MGKDREDPQLGLERLQRCEELRAGLVPARPGRPVVQLGACWGYPLEAWVGLPAHERQLVEILAADRGSSGSVFVGRSAARLMGMWLTPLTSETVELSLRSGGSSPSRQGHPRYTFRHSRLHDADIRTVSGCPVTSAVRTFADIARYHGFAEGLVAADWLQFRGLSREQLLREVNGLGRLAGIATVRRCASLSVACSDSGPESLARAHLLCAGIGPLSVQHRIGDYRVDLLIDDWLIIEIDGAVKYRGPDAEQVRQREFNRQKRIGNMGYVFLRYTPEFVRRHPDRFIAEVRETLEVRRRMLRR